MVNTIQSGTSNPWLSKVPSESTHGFHLNICNMNRKATVIVSALKKIHAKLTRKNVSTIFEIDERLFLKEIFISSI